MKLSNETKADTIDSSYLLTVSGPRSVNNKGEPWYIDPGNTNKSLRFYYITQNNTSNRLMNKSEKKSEVK